MLPQVLARRAQVPVSHAKDGETIRPGHIYVAPPDHHLLVNDGHIRLSRGPREVGASDVTVDIEIDPQLLQGQ